MLCSLLFPSFLFSPVVSAWVVSSDLSLNLLMSLLMDILKGCISDTVLLKNYYSHLTIFISQLKSLIYSHMLSTFSTRSHLYSSCVFCPCSAKSKTVLGSHLSLEGGLLSSLDLGLLVCPAVSAFWWIHRKSDFVVYLTFSYFYSGNNACFIFFTS